MYHRIVSQTGLGSVVTLEEAKRQCRVTHTIDDALITDLIGVAAEMTQKYTRRILTPATMKSVIEEYSGSKIQLFSGEVTNVTEVLLDGTAYTDYTFNEVTQKLTVSLAYDELEVTYECGFATLPMVVKQAILITISTLYNSREDFVTGVTASELPMTAQRLLDKVKFYGV